MGIWIMRSGRITLGAITILRYPLLPWHVRDIVIQPLYICKFVNSDNL